MLNVRAVPGNFLFAIGKVSLRGVPGSDIAKTNSKCRLICSFSFKPSNMRDVDNLLY